MPCLRREERRHFHFYKIFLGTLSKREAMPPRTPMLKSLRKKAEAEKRPKRKHLDTYCYNLTQKAKDGKLDAIIGRDKEIGRVVQILSRRTKNNPCLIGEPGVGKTAIARDSLCGSPRERAGKAKD